jgi:hypothetical protein
LQSSVLLWGEISPNLDPEKYDLDLDKGFFIEKNDSNPQILKEKKSKSPDFYNKFH